MNKVLPLTAAFAAALVVPAQASKLFTATATPVVGAPVSAEGSSVTDLTSNLLKAQNQFASFSNTAWTGNLGLFGVSNALNVSSNATGTNVRLTSPLTGLDRTFTGSSRTDVETQVVNWLKTEGGDQLAAIQKEITKRSAASVTDGAPASATALSANAAFDLYGFSTTGPSSLAQSVAPASTQDDLQGLGMGLGLNGGKFKAKVNGQTYNGEKMAVTLPLSLRLNETITLLGAVPLDYTDIEGTRIYGAAGTIGLNWKILQLSETSDWGWQVTPFGGATAKGSVDAATGALLGTYGGTSAVDYRVNEWLIVSMGNQVSAYDSIPVTVSGVKYDSNIEQQILKNGLKLGSPLTDRWLVETYGVNTWFVQRAAVSNYWTAGAGISYRLMKTFFVGLNANYDIGQNFQGYSFGLSSNWNF